MARTFIERDGKMKIIFNADDFGCSRGINFGIIDSFQKGLLTSTTLMVTMPGVKHTVELMKENPNLGVGLHLNFSLGNPITSGESLTDSNNKLMKPFQLPKNYVYKKVDIANEIQAQFDHFLNLTSKFPTHIDTHLFTSDKIEVIKNEVIKFGQENNIPVRNQEINEYPKVKFISHHNYNLPADLSYIPKHIDDILGTEIAEIMVHPGYIDQYLLDNSSYAIEKAKEVEFLTSSKIKKIFKKQNVDFISYKDLND